MLLTTVVLPYVLAARPVTEVKLSPSCVCRVLLFLSSPLLSLDPGLLVLSRRDSSNLGILSLNREALFLLNLWVLSIGPVGLLGLYLTLVVLEFVSVITIARIQRLHSLLLPNLYVLNPGLEIDLISLLPPEVRLVAVLVFSMHSVVLGTPLHLQGLSLHLFSVDIDSSAF